MTPKKMLLAIAILSVPAFFFTVGCTKNSDHKPPIHDTVTVIKKDTVTDTLYATKPDPTVNLTKGLLVYLPFSGNYADSSGNNNPTTAVGDPLTDDAHGWAKNAFGSSSGQKVIVTNNGSIKFDTAYSISFGFMVNSIAPQTYVSMVNPDNGRGPSFIIGTSLPAVPSVVMGIEDVTLGCDKEGVNDIRNITDTSGFTPQ